MLCTCRYGCRKTYATGREQHKVLSTGRKEGSGHGQQGKPKPAAGQNQKGKKRGPYTKKKSIQVKGQSSLAKFMVEK